MLKKPVFLTSVFFIMIVLLAGCSRGGTAPTPSTKPPVATAVPAVSEAAPAAPQAQAVVQPTAKPAASAPSTAQPAAVEEISVRSGRLTGAMDVREAPDEAANVLGQLPEGSLIIVTGASGEWYEMVYGGGAGGHGWIPQSAVSFEQPTATPVPATPTAVGVAAADGTCRHGGNSSQSRRQTARCGRIQAGGVELGREVGLSNSKRRRDLHHASRW